MKSSACDYWDLVELEKYFEIFDENCEIVNFNSDPTNELRFVEKYVENFQNKEDRWKELIPPGPRKVIFWLGCINESITDRNVKFWDRNYHDFSIFHQDLMKLKSDEDFERKDAIKKLEEDK